MSLLDTLPVAVASRVASIAKPSLLDTIPAAAAGKRRPAIDLIDDNVVAVAEPDVHPPRRRDVVAPQSRDVVGTPRRGLGRPAGTCGWQLDLKRMKADLEETIPEIPQPRRRARNPERQDDSHLTLSHVRNHR